MKQLIRILVVALTLGASGAYAQSNTHPEYDSQSAAGNSANWGVGG